MAHEFAENRYDKMQYRRCGRSGLLLPAISLGAWETFGGYRGEDVARECLYRAFDLGITHMVFAEDETRGTQSPIIEIEVWDRFQPHKSYKHGLTAAREM